MKIRNLFCQQLIQVVLLLLLLGLSAQAQTFVSARNGVDAGVCALTTPCRGVTYALTQTVEGGTVSVIDSGQYAPFAVNKSVTVQAAPGVVAVITRNSVGPGVTIAADSTERITIRGLTLNLPQNLLSTGTGGMSAGFDVTGNGTVAIESCWVSGFTVGVNAHMAGQIFVRDTQLSGGTTGILLQSEYLALRASVERCVTARYETGLSIASVPSAVLRVTVIDSQFSGNTFGVKVAPGDASTASVNFAQCTLANNRSGLAADGAGVTVRMANSTITDNGFGLITANGAALLSRGDNTVEGNSISGSFTGSFSAK